MIARNTYLMLAILLMNGCVGCQLSKPSNMQSVTGPTQLNASENISFPVYNESPSTVLLSPSNTPLIRTSDIENAVSITKVETTPPNALDLAMQKGTAKRAGPVTPEKFARWKKHAEMKVELEVQCCRVRHNKRALELIDEREKQFVKHVELELSTLGGTIEDRLKTFARLRKKYEDKLNSAFVAVAKQETAILTWEKVYKKPKLFKPFEEDSNMTIRALIKIVGQKHATTLVDNNIRSIEAFVETFLLEPQHDQLAELLHIDKESAACLVYKAAKYIPNKRLDEMKQDAERGRSFGVDGVLPPDELEE
ncbi:hypothetical protein Mal35_16870 [Gimesia maris]|uniref:hypothetical protein n=1 Tax=Gimesia maris TaxID=122 RepID=UPI00118A3E6C|nr:hypothetical protein [Gimesia maris]QDT78255.1 hypothetical protein Mal35_16870 [Gimesia maris]